MRAIQFINQSIPSHPTHPKRQQNRSSVNKERKIPLYTNPHPNPTRRLVYRKSMNLPEHRFPLERKRHHTKDSRRCAVHNNWEQCKMREKVEKKKNRVAKLFRCRKEEKRSRETFVVVEKKKEKRY